MTKYVHFTRVLRGCLVAWAAASTIVIGLGGANAAGPVQQAYFEPDYEASGFVIPAGMPSPEVYMQSVQQAGFFGNPSIASRLGASQSHCDQCGPSGCAGGACGGGGYGGGGYGGGGYGDGRYGDGGHGPGQFGDGAYDDWDDCGCGAGGCGLFGGCGLIGRCGLGRGGCLARLRSMCLFCGGHGCGVCHSIGSGYLLGALHSLRPYGEAGLSQQRWYDLSLDLMLLTVSGGLGDQVIATQGVAGIPVLRADDADAGVTAGGRISGAFICGPGGNIEVTYLGGNRWRDEAVATGPGLFSFLTDFGTAPPGGFAETDNTDLQRFAQDTTFHSGEVNYRRRTVGPYGRFQWSGLGGLRYLRFDDAFEYNTLGPGGFLDLQGRAANEMVGVQTGGDLWWNVIPGINAGIGFKGGPMGNRINRTTSVMATSLVEPRTADEYRSRTAWFREIEATMLYRLSHSWTLKTQYYWLYIDEVGYGVSTGTVDALANPGTPIDPIRTSSLTIQGFTIGAEYIW